MKEINGKVLYTPKGAAREYAQVGCNFYTGCPHGCEYCYLKRGVLSKSLGGKEVRLKKCLVNADGAISTFYKEMKENLSTLRETGIFLSFTTDPLIEETRDMTLMAIRACSHEHIPVWVLTKDATFTSDKISMSGLISMNAQLREAIHFGFTLTGRDDMEPYASTNEERIRAMEIMHNLGYPTFASVEPVIDWDSTTRVVINSLGVCDEYRIGLRSGVKRSYYNDTEIAERIDYLTNLIEGAGKRVILKKSVINRL